MPIVHLSTVMLERVWRCAGALSKILGAAVSDDQWLQAKLPVAMGGLGLRAVEDHTPVAFAASLLASKKLVHNLLGKADDDEVPPSLPQPVLDKISLKMGEQATTESLTGVSQKAASLKVDLLNQSILLNHIIEEGQVSKTARLRSLGLHLRATEFVPCLGVPIFAANSTCPSCSAHG